MTAAENADEKNMNVINTSMKGAKSTKCMTHMKDSF